MRAKTYVLNAKTYKDAYFVLHTYCAQYLFRRTTYEKHNSPYVQHRSVSGGFLRSGHTS